MTSPIIFEFFPQFGFVETLQVKQSAQNVIRAPHGVVKSSISSILVQDKCFSFKNCTIFPTGGWTPSMLNCINLEVQSKIDQSAILDAKSCSNAVSRSPNRMRVRDHANKTEAVRAFTQ